METHERLKLLISRLDLSQSEFADKMEIQRSSISHLLSGRNKPGFSFFEKLLETFPEINIEWLIAEQGDMLKTMNPAPSVIPFPDENENTDSQMVNDANEESNEGVENSVNHVDKPLKKNTKKEAEIEKILIIYADKTFDEIVPHKNE